MFLLSKRDMNTGIYLFIHLYSLFNGMSDSDRGEERVLKDTVRHIMM